MGARLRRAPIRRGKGRGLLKVAWLAPVIGVGLAPSPVHAQADAPRVSETTLELPNGSTLRYGISIPEGYGDSDPGPRPLVLALHPGGRARYYGSSFMRSTVEPALRSWGAVLVAPDVPGSSWATEDSEEAVLALLQEVLERYTVDPDRVLVTGFSMGGRGAWHMASRHPEVFAGAIVMAGSPGAGDVSSWDPSTPLYLVHSPDDEVVPFGPVEQAYLTLAQRGHRVELRVLPRASHYMMGAYVPALRMAGDWMLTQWRVD
jgi:predicted peptidase